MCVTPCVLTRTHTRTHTDTRTHGFSHSGEIRRWVAGQRWEVTCRVPVAARSPQRVKPEPPSQLGCVPHNGAIQPLCCSAALPARSLPRAAPLPPASCLPHPTPRCLGAVSRPPRLPLPPSLPLALGHTRLLPPRAILIWGTVGASLKGETLSWPWPSAVTSGLSTGCILGLR